MVRNLVILLSLGFAAAPAATLTLSQANLTGATGTTVGWGFTLVNDTASYLVVTAVQSTFPNSPFGISATNPAVEDYLSNWMVNNSFALAPGGTLTQSFSVVLGEGLGAFTIANGASGSEPGTLTVAYLLFDDDPFANPNAAAQFPEPNPFTANVSVTVTPAGVPEPSTAILLLGAGALVLRRRLLIALGLASCLFAQFPPPLPGIDGVAPEAFPAVNVPGVTPNCQVFSQPLTVRREGATELLGDVLVACSGNLQINPRNRLPVSTTPAAEVPRITVRVQTSAPLTNRLLLGSLTDAVLAVESPAAYLPPNRSCPSPSVDANGLCTGLVKTDSGQGQSGLSAAGPAINIYQGLLAGPNTVEFRGVPFNWMDDFGNPRLSQAYQAIKAQNAGVYAGQPVIASATVYFRVKSMRAAVGGVPVNSQVFATVSAIQVSTGTPLALDTASAVVGQVNSSFRGPAGNSPSQTFYNPRDPSTVQSGVAPSTEPLGPAGLPLAACQARPLDTATPSFRMRFDEGYAIVGRVRGHTPGDPQQDQKVTDINYNTESAFHDTSFGATNGMNRAGIADRGTRYRFLFRNVPAGAQLYAPVQIQGGPAGTMTLAMVDTDATTSGASSPLDSFNALAATTNGLRPLAQRGADQLAVYEVTSSTPFVTSSMGIPFHLAYSAGVTPGVVPVETSLAPFFVEPLPAASSTLPVPRFNNGAFTTNAMTFQPCNACGQQVQVSVLERFWEASTGRATWLLRVVNNGYNTIPSGAVSMTVSKVSGPGTVTSPSGVNPILFPIRPGESYVFAIGFNATDPTARVRAVIQVTGGCFATTQTLNFQPLQ